MIASVEELKLEGETLKDLDHPNIVQCLGFEETPAYFSVFVLASVYPWNTANRGFIVSSNMFRVVRLPVS